MILTLDKLMRVIAPHLCIACGSEGAVLCARCLETAGEPVVPRCAGCHKLSEGFKTCVSCQSILRAHSITVATVYEGVYEQLIRSMKFEAKRQAVEPIAQIMVQNIDYINEDFILCPLPTAPSRVRERGFDHTLLLSKTLAKQSGIKYSQLLSRNTNIRQLGSTRSKRFEQMEQEFHLIDPKNVAGKNILLIDDVVTTGASIAGATKALKEAGAKRVSALVFAQKI